MFCKRKRFDRIKIKDITEDSIMWEGWGTSLCWWAHHIGKLGDDELKNGLSNLLWGKGHDSLELNIVRYNIGGGSNPNDIEVLRQGGDIPEYKKGVDGQLSFLKKAKVLNDDIIVEVFGNSPPWYMTKNGKVTGNKNRIMSNIKDECIDDYAKYLVDVIKDLKNEEGILVKSVSPMNEPSSPTWVPGNVQEGCYWGPITRRRMFKVLKEKLDVSLIEVCISGCEENNMLQGFLGLVCEIKEISKINVHSYRLMQFTDKINTFGIEDNDIFRYFIRHFANKRDQVVWMSEWGSSNSALTESKFIFGKGSKEMDIEDAINISLKIIRDIVILRANAWVYWQAIEDINSKWGLIQVSFDNLRGYKLTRQYWMDYYIVHYYQ